MRGGTRGSDFEQRDLRLRKLRRVFERKVGRGRRAALVSASTNGAACVTGSLSAAAGTAAAPRAGGTGLQRSPEPRGGSDSAGFDAGTVSGRATKPRPGASILAGRSPASGRGRRARCCRSATRHVVEMIARRRCTAGRQRVLAAHSISVTAGIARRLLDRCQRAHALGESNGVPMRGIGVRRHAGLAVRASPRTRARRRGRDSESSIERRARGALRQTALATPHV